MSLPLIVMRPCFADREKAPHQIEAVSCLEAKYYLLKEERAKKRTDRCRCFRRGNTPQGQGSETTEGLFSYTAKTRLNTGGRTGFLVCLAAVCCVLSVCGSQYCHSSRELFEADVHISGVYGSQQVLANAWDAVRSTPSPVGRGSRAPVDLIVCFEFVRTSIF